MPTPNENSEFELSLISKLRELGPLRVLIASEISLARVISVYLKEIGFSSSHVNDGNSLIRDGRDANPAILIVEAELPGLSGIDAIQQIQADAMHPASRIPIVMVCGQQLEESSLAAGADVCIALPISPISLWIALNRLLS